MVNFIDIAHGCAIFQEKAPQPKILLSRSHASYERGHESLCYCGRDQIGRCWGKDLKLNVLGRKPTVERAALIDSSNNFFLASWRGKANMEVVKICWIMADSCNRPTDQEYEILLCCNDGNSEETLPDPAREFRRLDTKPKQNNNK